MATVATSPRLAEMIAAPTNDAAPTIDLSAPYVAEVTIRGQSAFLYHRWSDDAVAEKAAAAKGSKAKKTDDVESYVYRDSDGNLGIPGVYLSGALVDPRNGAAKYRQDPRSPRKSALDLFKAGVLPLTDVATVYRADGKPADSWDYLDRRRVLVQRNAITRVRPALAPGWSATFQLMVQTPEYIPEDLLLDVLGQAGRLVGIGDFRPTFGRFAVTGFRRLVD